MNPILAERLTVPNDKSIVVFLIGMRINKWWMIHRWLPVALAMPRMLKELRSRPDSGYLGGMFLPGMTVQYWESTEKLLAYAHDRASEHYPAWSRFQRKIGTDGTVGIWHETYSVPAGAFESVYVNMPRHGLGTFIHPVPARGARASAARRLAHGSADLFVARLAPQLAGEVDDRHVGDRHAKRHPRESTLQRGVDLGDRLCCSRGRGGDVVEDLRE